MSRQGTTLGEALDRLDEYEREAVRKLWRIQWQIKQEEKKLRRKNIYRVPR